MVNCALLNCALFMVICFPVWDRTIIVWTPAQQMVSFLPTFWLIINWWIHYCAYSTFNWFHSLTQCATQTVVARLLFKSYNIHQSHREKWIYHYEFIMNLSLWIFVEKTSNYYVMKIKVEQRSWESRYQCHQFKAVQGIIYTSTIFWGLTLAVYLSLIMRTL